MNHKRVFVFLWLLYLIWPAAPQPSFFVAEESLIQAGRKLAQGGHQSDPKPVQEISPSPSPYPAVVKPHSGGGEDVANPPKIAFVDEETCDPDFSKCHHDVYNVSACLLAKTRDATNGLFILVRNNGENSLQLNATIFPGSLTLEIGDILGHQGKKVNLSSNASRSLSIVLSAADWTCRIGREVGVPLNFPSYVPSIKPVNGAYVLLGTALLIGVVWACCKLGKDARHLNGVPYQELEMGQQEAGSSANVDTLNDWDQSWDEDDVWDEEKAVKSPGGNHVGNKPGDGASSKPADTNGWGREWDD